MFFFIHIQNTEIEPKKRACFERETNRERMVAVHWCCLITQGCTCVTAIIYLQSKNPVKHTCCMRSSGTRPHDDAAQVKEVSTKQHKTVVLFSLHYIQLQNNLFFLPVWIILKIRLFCFIPVLSPLLSHSVSFVSLGHKLHRVLSCLPLTV